MTQTIDRYTLLAFLPFVLVAPLLGIALSRNVARRRLLIVMTVAALGGIVAVTLGGRMLKLTDWGHGVLTLDWLSDAASWKHAFDVDRTWLLNAVLFAPAGCLLTLTTRRPQLTVLLLGVGSMLIEIVQRWTSLGVADVGDLLANLVGASAGTVIAVLVLRTRALTT